MNTLAELKEQLIKEKLFDDKRPIEDCEDSDIELIRVNQNVKRLPQMYVEFARLMGNGAGFLFETDATCKELLDVKSRAVERFQHYFTKQQFELPDNAFIYDCSWDDSTENTQKRAKIHENHGVRPIYRGHSVPYFHSNDLFSVDSWDYFTYFLDDAEEENPVVYRYVTHNLKNPEVVSSFWDDLVQRYIALSQIQKDKIKYLEDTDKALIKAELERRKRVAERNKNENKGDQ